MLFVYLLLLVASASAKSYPHRWYDLELADLYFEDFKNTHDRHYESAEENDKRFEIFKQNLIKVNQMNQEIGPNFGINMFSDLTHEEFSRRYLGLDANITMPMTKYVNSGIAAPPTFDWRDQSKVSPVKAQNTCGSCWAFSTTGLLESQCLINKNQAISLSEQQLVDCDTQSGGCVKGSAIYALGYIQTAGGIETEDAYPYTATAGTCNFNPSQAQVKVNTFQALQISADDDIKDALVNNGPLSIGLDARAFKELNGDVLNCGAQFDTPNHAVLLVGYGTDYWIIKNSWGAGWGESGYVRIKMGDNPCAMNNIGYITATLQ